MAAGSATKKTRQKAQLEMKSRQKPSSRLRLIQYSEPYDGETPAGVDAGPLAGRAQAEEEARERKIPPLPSRHEAPHEEVHEQDEEYRVCVYGRDAGLDKVHEVEGEDDRAADGYLRRAAHALYEIIEYGQHEQAEERAHETPAEGRHAEETDAYADDELAKGRMCYLVGVDVLDVLQRGAGVVDLVEVAAVQIARGLGYELLLVEERGGVLVIGKGCRVEHIARSIVDGELGKGERVRGGQAQVLALDTLRRLLGVLVAG